MATALRLHAPIVLPCEANCTVLRDAVVDIGTDGRIIHCGSSAEAPELSDGVRLREFTGILLPGLVNTHAHTPMTVLRGIGGDLPLLRWLNEAIWPAEGRMRAGDARAGMLLGCLEMLRAGVTTSSEMYFFAEALAEGALAAGSRIVLAAAVIAIPGTEQRLGTWQQQLAGINAWIDADGSRFGPGERIELAYGPHSAYMLPEEALVLVAEAARERDALLHIHVAEAANEDGPQRERHGSVPLMLEKLGVLGGRVLGAHCIHLSDADIDVFARNAVGVAHCPGSNGKLASGIARLVDLRAAGVRVGLGTDGPASNDDLDLLEEARLAAMFARLAKQDAAVITAAQALVMATRGGAEALGRDDIGALETGRWADVVHIGVDDPAFAAGLDVPDGQLLANLVWGAGSRTVRDAWVAGEQVLADGEPTNADRAAAQAEAGVVAARLRG